VGTLTQTTSATIPGGSERVYFRWDADSSTTGAMTVQLADGRRYLGRYVQISTPATAQPLWGRHDKDWPEWPQVDPNGNTEYGEHYTHRVVASLRTADGREMYCHLSLKSRAAGMSGGAVGHCHLDDGGVIQASIPAR
jgi:hypothetical protein